MLIREATAAVHVVRALTIFVRGPLGPHSTSLAPMWQSLLRAAGAKRLVRYRVGAQAQWQKLPAEFEDFSWFLGRLGAGAGCRWLEVGVPEGEDGMHVEVADLQPVLGVERASHIRVLFPDETTSATIAALGEWAISDLPIWWGAAGFVFHHTSGPTFIAHERIAALAKRHWGVQIQDVTTLQWDALRGMPSVNWLTLIGDEFARSKEMNLEALDAEKRALEAFGVFQRRGAFGVALAAGRQPLEGDINLGDDLEPYVAVARRIKPLLLTEQTLLFGPFARPEVSRAWLGRFGAPRAWLDSDIKTD
jgi:hypothetical protein